MEVVWSSGFNRSFRKITKKNPLSKDEELLEMVILLVDIGSHDDVY